MTVSQRQEGSAWRAGAGERAVEGLLWLRRELEWEQVLSRLRVAAGVLPGETRTAGAAGFRTARASAA